MQNYSINITGGHCICTWIALQKLSWTVDKPINLRHFCLSLTLFNIIQQQLYIVFISYHMGKRNLIYILSIKTYSTVRFSVQYRNQLLLVKCLKWSLILAVWRPLCVWLLTLVTDVIGKCAISMEMFIRKLNLYMKMDAFHRTYLHGHR